LKRLVYYLNHVGYKVREFYSFYFHLKPYYLNHVGYKVRMHYFINCDNTQVLSEPCGI